MPTKPQKDAGSRTEPPVSVPIAQGTSPAATAAALPELEPPGAREKSQGFRVAPKAENSPEEPIANSSMFARPSMTAPSFFNLLVIVASYVD